MFDIIELIRVYRGKYNCSYKEALEFLKVDLEHSLERVNKLLDNLKRRKDKT